MTTQQYNELLKLIQYGVRLYRRFGIAYKVSDVSPIDNSVSQYLNDMQTSSIVYHMYPVIRKIIKPMSNFDFVFEQPVCNMFYAIKNYIQQYYGKPSFGDASKDLLNKHIHDIPSDYQVIHKQLFNIEDEGYYRLFGFSQDPTITLVGASTQYTNHNRFNLNINLSYNFDEKYSVVPQNNKYWIEQNELVFVCKTAVPNMYLNTDVIRPDGTVIQNVYWQINFGTRTITSIKSFAEKDRVFMNEQLSTNYKVSDQITTTQSIPSGSKICLLKELHIPDTYTYTNGDILICFGIASDFYTGTEIFSPDLIYQLPNITP